MTSTVSKMFKSKKRLLIIIAIVLVVGIVSVAALGLKKPLLVDTVKIEKIDFVEYHLEESTVIAKDAIKVYAEGAGNISELLVQEGSLVKKGQLILNIDTSDLEHQLELLKAQRDTLVAQKQAETGINRDAEIKLQKESIQIAKDNVASQAVELERQRTLFNNGAISKNKLEELEQSYKKSLSQLNIEEFKLNTLQESIEQGGNRDAYFDNQIKKLELEISNIEQKISEMSVIAPIDGVLSELSIKKGDLVTAKEQLFTVFNPGLYQIESYVLAKEVKNLSLGQETIIELESSNKVSEVKGSIVSIAPNAIDVVSPLGLVEKKVKVIIEPSDVDDFILGESVDVKFVSYQKDDARLISKDYIFPVDDGEAIWVVEGNKTKLMIINKEFDTSASVVIRDTGDDDILVVVPPYPEAITEDMEVRIK